MTLPVYVDRALSAVAEGASLTLRGDEGRHAATVRRTKPGEQIDVVNGTGLRARIEVTGATKSEVTGRVLAVTQEQAAGPHITLVQALAKGGRDEQAVETATEYGVDAVIPWQSARCIAQWPDAARAAKGRARWEATALAAAKQSRRSFVPEVADVRTTKQLPEALAGMDAVFVCHESGTVPITEHLGETYGKVAIVVGPEGGITDDEVAFLESAGARTVLLGEHVLRSATAGPWAIAVIRSRS